MRINEVEVKQLNEGIGDYMRAGLYNTLGIGGQKGNAAANMYNFLDSFSQQYKQAQDSAKEAGMPMNANNFINSYMNRYGWQASKKQKKVLSTLVNDPKKLAKAMYSIGISQARDPQGYVMNPRAQGIAVGGTRQQGAQPKLNKQQLMKALQQAQAQLKQLQSGPQLSSESQGIISSIQGLTGPENLDDLAAITKVAMQMLYGQNKEKYNELYKEITTGQKADSTPEEQAAAKRVEKLKIAAKAADAEAAPFSKLPGEAPAPKTPEEFAARRIAKQKAAAAALNPTGGVAPVASPAAQAQQPAVEPSPSMARTSAPVKGADGQELPTSPSMKPRQVPGAMFGADQQKSTQPASITARRTPAKLAR